ncbi:hypothetical protein KIPB_003370, partial [Kipferlia bialata]|eukprot:g3370.t1
MSAQQTFMQTLLKWSLANSDSQTFDSDAAALDPERQAWLEGAMNQMVTDGATLMK